MLQEFSKRSLRESKCTTDEKKMWWNRFYFRFVQFALAESFTFISIQCLSHTIEIVHSLSDRLQCRIQPRRIWATLHASYRRSFAETILETRQKHELTICSHFSAQFARTRMFCAGTNVYMISNMCGVMLGRRRRSRSSFCMASAECLVLALSCFRSDDEPVCAVRRCSWCSRCLFGSG